MSATNQSIISPEQIVQTTYISMHPIGNPVIEILQKEQPEQPEQPEHKEQIDTLYSIQIFEETSNTSLQYFGILEIRINDTPMVTQVQEIDLSSDRSGSMDDMCADRRSKMQHANHTAKNIISVLGKNSNKSTTYFKLTGFDDVVEDIIPLMKVDDDAVPIMHDLINKNMFARNSTNIEAALQNTQTQINARMCLNPTHKQVHIMMTDGDITVGSDNVEKLLSYIDPSYPNIFIGYGESHNATLLQTLASRTNGEYYFIGKIEEAGLVYGEIIHGILYQALTNITITINNGEIYDYKTNTWSSMLNVSSINSEAKKTYHIRSTSPDDVFATIIALSTLHIDPESQLPLQITEQIDILPPLLNIYEEKLEQNQEQEKEQKQEQTELVKYMLRQRAQELLFKSHQLSANTQYLEQKHHSTPSPVLRQKQHLNPPKLNRHIITSHHLEQNQKQKQMTPAQLIKQELNQFLKFLTQYMNENNLVEDDFHQTLCADIQVTLQTIDMPSAVMYSASRQQSQGRELSYTCSGPSLGPSSGPTSLGPKKTGDIYSLKRQNAFSNDNDSDDDTIAQLPILRPLLSRTHTTSHQEDIMRAVSNDRHDEESKEFDDQDHVRHVFNSYNTRVTTSPYKRTENSAKSVNSEEEEEEEEEEEC